MSDERLEEILTALHAELAKADTLDPEQVAHLEAALSEIQDKIDDHEGESSLVHRLRESAQHFEETHPRLTLTIGHLADMLAQMGI